jgi:hypothetical protein
MRAIEQTSLALLAVTLICLFAIVMSFAIDRYAMHPPLYTPPPETKSFSNISLLHDATSLEGLRSVCLSWAQRQDEMRQFNDELHELHMLEVKETTALLTLTSIIFSGGLLFIYLQARRLRRASANAL